MAHKTLIGGTAYEIDGGKALVGATAYEIDKGKALVGGTAYEVGFAPDMLLVTIVYTATNNCNVSHPEISSFAYWGTETFEVTPESVFTFNFRNNSDDSVEERVIENGTLVYTQKLSSGGKSSYQYTITKNATIAINCPKSSRGTVTITEE